MNAINQPNAADSAQKAHHRLRRVFSAMGTAIFGKGSLLIVNAVSIPIVVRYLGAEQYGIWVTISTSVALLVYFDIGIASTLTNLISESYAVDDRRLAGEYLATAFWTSVAVVLSIGALVWLAWPHIDFGALLNIKDHHLEAETSQSALIAGILFLCNLPLGLGARALAGYQELHFANLFTGASNVLALGAIVAVILAKGSLVALITAYTGTITFGSLACFAWVVLHRKPWLLPTPSRVRPSLARKVLSSGGQFFLIQLSGMIVFNSDNLVIAHFLTPSQVTPYSVTWKLATYANALQVLLSQALWPAYAEAWSSRHFEWIRNTYRRVHWITLASLTCACALLIPFGRKIIKVWAGSAAVPTFGLMLLMCVWMVILAVTTNQACLMGATSRVKKQAISSSLAAVINLTLSVYWVRTMGTFGVLLATVVSYVLFILAVQAWEVQSILHVDDRVLDGA